MQNPDAHNKIRLALAEGRTTQAEELLRRHLQRRPDDAAALGLMGSCCTARLNFDQAAYYFKRALALAPLDQSLSLGLYESLRRQNKFEEAADAITSAASAHRDRPGLIAQAAKAQLDARRVAEAGETIAAGLASHPDDPDLLHAESAFHHRVGDSARARSALERLVRLRPEDLDTRYSLASVLNYFPDASPKEQHAAHAAFGRLIERASRFEPYEHPATDNPDRPLRIGLLSPDLRGHSVAFFAEPILEHLDRAAFSVHCYYTRDSVDETTDRLRMKADSFIAAVRSDDALLARRIHEDRVDILIELCGLFIGNSLPAMVYRPAPVQATYIGYPNTTGIAAIDYRIVDSITDPPHVQEKYTAERLVRLDPCFLCYRPADRFVAVPPALERRDGPFTFGSFNNAMKLSDATLDLWSRVLAAAPGTRLLAKAAGMEDPPMRLNLLARMVAAGIDTRRVEVAGRTPDSLDHLRRYHEVDLSLDTFPYNGTTTTCESLLMGVPVITLTGRTHASRVGASLLSAVGLPELVFAEPEAYVAAAARLAADRDQLAVLRRGLRERMTGSVLCDGPAFGARLGTLLRQMWRSRCGEAPA